MTHGCILDAGSLGPGIDLKPILATLDSWDIHHATSPDDVLPRIAGADVVLSNKVMLSAATIAAAARLRFISVLATGTNNVDLAAAAARGIPVSNVRDYSTDTVVQHTINLMLSLASNLLAYTAAVRAGRWQTSPFFCYFERPITELAGKTLTIVGYGAQGRKVAQVAAALGMRVQIARRPDLTAATAAAPQEDRLPLDELLPHTDVLTFHCPLTPATTGLLHQGNIYRLPAGAFVLNCARGGLVDEAALAAALSSGHLGGAAIDVTTSEPPPASHPLMQVTHPNFILTPHIAWGSLESRTRLVAATADNIRAFFAGRPCRTVTA